MSVIYCEYCGESIDTDKDAEHFDTKGRFDDEEQHVIDFAVKESLVDADFKEACYQRKKDYIRNVRALAAEDFSCYARY